MRNCLQAAEGQFEQIGKGQQINTMGQYEKLLGSHSVKVQGPLKMRRVWVGLATTGFAQWGFLLRQMDHVSSAVPVGYAV